jgi:hypothetical protein
MRGTRGEVGSSQWMRFLLVVLSCVLGVACVKTTGTSGSASPSASVQEVIVDVGQRGVTGAGNGVTVFSYVFPVTGARGAGSGMMFSAADVQACAGPHAKSNTGVSRSQFAVETPDQTGWASVAPVKEPALKGAVLKANQCVRGWITFRVPSNQKAQYVVLLSTNVIKWRIP